MPSLDRVRQVFEGSDRLSSTVQKIGQSFESLSRSISGTSREGQELGVNFRTLDRMMDEVGETATPTVANRFRILEEAINSTVTSDNILSFRQLENEIDRLGEQTTLTDQTLDELKRTGREIANTFFAASVSGRELREHVDELGEQGELTAGQMTFLKQAIDRVVDAEDNVNVERFKEELSDLALTERFVSVETNSATRAINEQTLALLKSQGPMSSATATAIGLGSAYERVEEKTSDLIEEQGLLSLSLTQTSGAALLYSTAVSIVARTSDNAEEEIEELTDAVHSLRNTIGNPFTTLNLGPLNISLDQLASTVFSLTAVLGPLVMTVVGLATVLGTLLTVVVSFLGVGFLQFLDEIESRFAGITNRMEAMEALGSGLMKAFEDALSPLMDATIGGETPFQFFISTIRGALQFVRDFSEAMAEIGGMPVVAQSLDRISEALFTADDGVRMVDSLKEAMDELLPLATDLLVFLINNLPEFISFTSDIAEKTGPALADILGHIIPLFAQLVRLGAEIFEVMAVLVSIMAGIVGWFVKWFDAVNNVLGPGIRLGEIVENLIAVFIGFGVALKILSGIITVSTTLLAVFMQTGLLAVRVGQALNTVVWILTGSYVGGYIPAIKGAIAATWAFVASLTALQIATGLIIITAILAFIAAMIKWEETTRILDAAFEPLNEKLKEFFEWAGLNEQRARRLADALTRLAEAASLLAFGPLGMAIASRRQFDRNRERMQSRGSDGAGSSGQSGGTTVNVHVEGDVNDPEKTAREFDKQYKRRRRIDETRRTSQF